MLAAVVPRELVLVPAAVELLAAPPADRARALLRTLRVAVLPAALAATAASVGVLTLGPTSKSGQVVALALTTGAAAFVSPLQDHARRLFHLAGMPWKAAALSIVFALGVVVVAVIGLALGIDEEWIPLGSMAAGNIASLLLGIALAGKAAAEPVGHYALRHLSRSGRWLVVNSAVPPATSLAVNSMIVALAGAEALGYAEAARVVAQPILVFSAGLAHVLNPRSMEAARNNNKDVARRLSRILDYSVIGVGLVVLLLFGFAWEYNLLMLLVPTAFSITGLAPVTMAANMINGTVKSERAELIARSRERALTKAEVVANGGRLLVATTASVTRSFALGLGLVFSGLVRILLLKRMTQTLYQAQSSCDSYPHPDKPQTGWAKDHDS